MDRDVAHQRTEITAPGVNPPISHYTDAVRYGDLVFVSGCAPLNESLEVVGESAAEQAEAVFANMSAVLAASGCGFGDVLKVTVYLTDVRDRQSVNEVRKRYFGAARPASTLIGVSALAVDGMKVEVDAVAAARGSS